MKKRQYFLAYEGGNLVASFDAFEDNKQLKVLLAVCEKSGYIVQQVSVDAYEKQRQIEEEKDLKEIFD